MALQAIFDVCMLGCGFAALAVVKIARSEEFHMKPEEEAAVGWDFRLGRHSKATININDPCRAPKYQPTQHVGFSARISNPQPSTPSESPLA